MLALNCAVLVPTPAPVNTAESLFYGFFLRNRCVRGPRGIFMRPSTTGSLWESRHVGPPLVRKLCARAASLPRPLFGRYSPLTPHGQETVPQQRETVPQQRATWDAAEQLYLAAAALSQPQGAERSRKR